MRGIKVGNILVFRSSAICVIRQIITEGTTVTLVGIDSNNTLHKGPIEEWELILNYKDELPNFEDSILNNIMLVREV